MHGVFAGVTGTSPLRYDGKAEPRPKSVFRFLISPSVRSRFSPRPDTKRKTTVSVVFLFGRGNWIRTNDDGVRVRSLTAWRYP